MSKQLIITKEKILDTAFNIVKKNGIEEVSNRSIAKRINCSIRPIYYQFNNSSELKRELTNYIEKYFYRYLMNNMTDNIPYYKQVGINYIKFAREENNLFKFLFMTKGNNLKDEVIDENKEEYQELVRLIKLSTKLKDDEIEKFHTKMWIFTHGIATLICTGGIMFSDEEIETLLSSEFQALMLLEDNPNNKWDLSKYKDWRDKYE